MVHLVYLIRSSGICRALYILLWLTVAHRLLMVHNYIVGKHVCGSMHKSAFEISATQSWSKDDVVRTYIDANGSVHPAYNSSFSTCFFSRNNIFLSQQISQRCFSAGLSAEPNGANFIGVVISSRGAKLLIVSPQQIGLRVHSLDLQWGSPTYYVL
jgi:hypothetical protein